MLREYTAEQIREKYQDRETYPTIITITTHDFFQDYSVVQPTQQGEEILRIYRGVNLFSRMNEFLKLGLIPIEAFDSILVKPEFLAWKLKGPEAFSLNTNSIRRCPACCSIETPRGIVFPEQYDKEDFEQKGFEFTDGIGLSLECAALSYPDYVPKITLPLHCRLPEQRAGLTFLKPQTQLQAV